MDSNRSSRLSQDVEIPPMKHANTGNGQLPAVNGTTMGHTDTNVKNTSEELVPYPVEIEPSVEEEEEGAQEESVSHNTESDEEEGLRNVPLNDDRRSVGFRGFPPLMKLRKTFRLLLL